MKPPECFRAEKRPCSIGKISGALRSQPAASEQAARKQAPGGHQGRHPGGQDFHEVSSMAPVGSGSGGAMSLLLATSQGTWSCSGLEAILLDSCPSLPVPARSAFCVPLSTILIADGSGSPLCDQAPAEQPPTERLSPSHPLHGHLEHS